MKRLILLCVCLCLIAALTPAVSAGAYYTGTLGQDSGWVSSNWNNTQDNIFTDNMLTLYITQIENSQNSVSYFHFDWVEEKATYATGAPSYASIPMNITDSFGRVVATGTAGYQRNFDTAFPIPNELPGYQYLLFDSWNIYNLTGNVYLNVNFNNTLLYTPTMSRGEALPPAGTGAFSAIVGGARGFHTWNKNYVFKNTYVVQQGEDILLYGIISKEVGGQIYNGRGMVFRADTGALIASEPTLSAVDFNFMGIPRNIIVAARDSQGTIWNSSVLAFSEGGTITPTPTPTSTAVPTTPIGPQNPIPAGYVRSMAECVDGQTSGRLHDCTVSLKDVENGTWSNSTWEWGYWWIDTLPNHTIDAYGVLSGYTSVERTDQPASGTRMIELIMWPEDIPAAATGKVNLFVIVNDYESGNAITGASVSFRDSATGVTTSHTTGHSGTVQTTATNATMMYITVSKYGYDTRTVPFETSDFGPDTKRVELFKSVVTTVPTATIPHGGVTTAVTVDPAGTPDPAGGSSGYSTAKGQQMMDYLAMNGMDLVQLCVMVTILGLLGFKMGGR